jgi:hypothetical protein
MCWQIWLARLSWVCPSGNTPVVKETFTVGAQSIARAQSIAPRHSTYVIMPKKPKFRKFLFGKIKKEEFAGRFLKKTVYFRV